MITRIEAHNYRCFPRLAIDLDRYHVLAGANGAGKTTLLDIPVLLGDLSQRGGVVAAFLERQGNPHLARTFRCPPDYRRILNAAGHWPGELPKPPRPKEALAHLRKNHGTRGFKADFGRLAATMSVKNCQDPAFNQLRDTLRAWFPEQP